MTAAHAVAIAALRRAATIIPRARPAHGRGGRAGRHGPVPTGVAAARVRVVVRAAWRHFAAFVPLVHVPYDGEGYGRSQYVLAEDWLGTDGGAPTEADARVHLARRYFAAFGPACDRGPRRVRRSREGWHRCLARGGEGASVTSWSSSRAMTGAHLYDSADGPDPAATRRHPRGCWPAGTACCCRTRRSSASESSPTTIGPGCSRRTRTCCRRSSSTGSSPARGSCRAATAVPRSCSDPSARSGDPLEARWRTRRPGSSALIAAGGDPVVKIAR